ncbi:MAG: S-layer homology domain-containing protein [Chroococcidiopsidaceae cyanobacterium CP_BM_RX_35]|nr:S-layer homology domain-containing protein [Chroococcidiopsidaceae cyanobacterium CP_BM_RX_35]
MNTSFHQQLSFLLGLSTIAVLGSGSSTRAQMVPVPETTVTSAFELAPHAAQQTRATFASTKISNAPAPTGVDTSQSPNTIPSAPAPSSAPSPSVGTNFSDVGADYWAYPFIQGLATQNVIVGFPDGSFRPDQPVTRAEFAAMLQKAFKPNAVRQFSSSGFADVPSNYWAAAAIKAAYEGGFLAGYPNNLFLPNQTIPKVQTITGLASGLGLTPKGSAVNVVNTYYTDAGQIPTYAVNQVAAATQDRLVVNYPDVKVLDPGGALSRAQAAAYIYQALVALGQQPPLASNLVATNYIVGGPTSVSQTTPTTPSAPPQAENPSGLSPGRSTRGGSSYIGVAGNIGISGGQTSLGIGNVAVISKIGLTHYLSVRPGIVTGDNPVILLPITFDLSSQKQSVLGTGFRISPYVGGGLAINTGHNSDAGGLVTGGVDLPITRQFTVTAAVNAAFINNTSVGVLIGVGYNFNGF